MQSTPRETLLRLSGAMTKILYFTRGTASTKEMPALPLLALLFPAPGPPQLFDQSLRIQSLTLIFCSQHPNGASTDVASVGYIVFFIDSCGSDVLSLLFLLTIISKQRNLLHLHYLY